MELLRRAFVQGDQDTWAGVQQCLGELVIGWLRSHPRRETACRWESEENYVALAFERFWQATAQQRVVFKTFAGALVYLHASLHGPFWIRFGPTRDQNKSRCPCQEN